jgi:hypothetical protein
LARWFGPHLLGTAMMVLAGAMLLTTCGTSFLAGLRGVQNKRWKGSRGINGLLVIGLLHILQPLARTAGRIKGRWHLRKQAPMFGATDLLDGDLVKRDVWLHRLVAHMTSCGWVARPCDEWDDADIEVLGPGPYTLKLTSVYEEDLQRAMHHVRYRITPKMKVHAPIVVALLMAMLVGITQALYLTPLAVPIVYVLTKFVGARKLMVQAVSQMAMECGWPIGMPKAKAYY